MAKTKRTVILSPMVGSEAVDLAAGLTWRKRVLKPTTVDYKGRAITFDEPYMKNLANSYAAKAYAQVPFTLADDKNQHTDDPERVRGDVIGLDMARPGEEPGLYANIVFPTEEAAKALLMNPKLAVSCRLTEKNGVPAVKHVCGTTDARVADLGPWQPVSLSADEQGEIIDLTTYDQGDEVADDVLDFSTMTDEEIDAILEDAAPDVADEIDPPAVITDETDPDDQEPIVPDLSADSRAAIDLANSRAEAAHNEVHVLKANLAAEKWGRERAELANDGVPPDDLDLAAPLLSQPADQVLDLSAADGSDLTVNASEIVRGLLESRRGTIDLTGPVGHAVGSQEQSDAEQEKADIAAHLASLKN